MPGGKKAKPSVFAPPAIFTTNSRKLVIQELCVCEQIGQHCHCCQLSTHAFPSPNGKMHQKRTLLESNGTVQSGKQVWELVSPLARKLWVQGNLGKWNCAQGPRSKQLRDSVPPRPNWIFQTDGKMTRISGARDN